MQAAVPQFSETRYLAEIVNTAAGTKVAAKSSQVRHLASAVEEGMGEARCGEGSSRNLAEGVDPPPVAIAAQTPQISHGPA